MNAYLSKIAVLGVLCALPFIPQNSALSHTEGHKIVAEVNGVPIYEDEFLAFAVQVAERLGQDINTNPDLMKKALDTFIERRLILENAEKDKVDTMPGFDEALADLKEGLMVEYYITKLEDKLVHDDDVLKQYNEQKQAHTPRINYHALHILVASEDEAKELIALLEKPEQDFATLARERSRDPSAQSNHGDLGFFDPDTMVPEFAEAVKTLKKGELSDPVKTQFGWHVIKLVDSRETPFASFETMKKTITDDLFIEAFKAHIESLKSDADIVYHDTPGIDN